MKFSHRPEVDSLSLELSLMSQTIGCIRRAVRKLVVIHPIRVKGWFDDGALLLQCLPVVSSS